MSRIWVRFLSNEDREEGIYILGRKTQVDNLAGEIFGISTEDLPVLEDNQVKYDKVSTEEVAQFHRKFHAFWSSKNRKKRDKEIKEQLREIESELKQQQKV